MDRIYSNCFPNKKKTVGSFIRKFVLLLAAFVMMAGVGYAGPTYTYNPFLKDTFANEFDVTTLGGTYFTKNMSDSDDSWNGSFGYTDSDAYTGVYIGTFPAAGNPSYPDLQVLINAFLNPDPSFEGYGKRDYESPFDLDTINEVTNLDITYEYGNGNLHTGSWDVSTSDGSNISFYGVKKSGEFALYYIDGQGASSGIYTTAHVGPNYNPSDKLSNLFVVKIHLGTPDTPPGENPIPEPTTMLLFGFSLIGLAGVARRRNGKF